MSSEPPNNPVLPQDLSICHSLIEELRRSLDESQREKNLLKNKLEQILRRLYGPRGERIDPAQLLLFAEAIVKRAQAEATPEPDEPAAPAAASNVRKGRHGRHRLSPNLPRVRMEHPVRPEQIPCPGCGRERTRFAEEISEQLEYKPASLFVIEHVRPKLACADCREHVTIAEPPAQPIDKGLPGPGLIAHIVVSKYADHLPLHRLEGILARHGAEISRSTMCGWVAAAADLLEPLYDRIVERLSLCDILQTDETRVPVRDETSDKTRSGRLWAVVGDARQEFIAFHYTCDRSGDGPAEFLADFRGYLQADACSVYDRLYADGRIVEVGCWAHARRHFYDARDSDAARSHVALAYIRRLYEVEEETKNLDPPSRSKVRQEKSVPILAELYGWIEREKPTALPKSPMGQAIGYALNHRAALLRYCDDGAIEIDNNACERALRGVAIGRKNWLFAGSDEGGRRAAILYTFVASCRRNGLDPFVYLRDVLTAVSTHPSSRIDELLPDVWKSTRGLPAAIDVNDSAATDPAGDGSAPPNPS